MKNNKSIPIFVLGLLVGMLVMYFFKTYTTEKIPQNITPTEASSPSVLASLSQKKEKNASTDIDKLTEENRVIQYVKKHRKLPPYYITKVEARKKGWIASEGNLCEVLPGKAIGGDKFGNREKNLPIGETYYEADVNYHCGRRGSDRIVFTQKGIVYLTKNHYKTFQKQ